MSQHPYGYTRFCSFPGLSGNNIMHADESTDAIVTIKLSAVSTLSVNDSGLFYFIFLNFIFIRETRENTRNTGVLPENVSNVEFGILFTRIIVQRHCKVQYYILLHDDRIT